MSWITKIVLEIVLGLALAFVALEIDPYKLGDCMSNPTNALFLYGVIALIVVLLVVDFRIKLAAQYGNAKAIIAVVILLTVLSVIVFSAVSEYCGQSEVNDPVVVTPIPTPEWQEAAYIVKAFYEVLNAAENSFEFEGAWDMLSETFQCSVAMKLYCDINNFTPFWAGIEGEKLGVRARYEIRACNARVIDVHLVYYNRPDRDYSDPTGADDWLHLTLDEEEDVLKIDKSQRILGSSCPVVIEFITN